MKAWTASNLLPKCCFTVDLISKFKYSGFKYTHELCIIFGCLDTQFEKHQIRICLGKSKDEAHQEFKVLPPSLIPELFLKAFFFPKRFSHPILFNLTILQCIRLSKCCVYTISKYSPLSLPAAQTQPRVFAVLGSDYYWDTYPVWHVLSTTP